MVEARPPFRLISYWKRLRIAILLKYCYTGKMKSKVTINERGALTIPVKMRETFGIKPNDELIIEDTEQGLLLRPAFSVPVEIYTEDRIKEFASDEEAIGKLIPPEK